MDSTAKKKWFVLYTKANAEKKVAKRVKRRGLETYLPLHTVKRKWSDRVKLVDVPLFQSYVFVKCVQEELFSILEVRGMAYVVFQDKKPAVVMDEEIEAIKEFLVMAKDKDIFSVGDDVDIVCGPFKDYPGQIIDIDEERVCLVLDQIGAKMVIPLIEIERSED